MISANSLVVHVGRVTAIFFDELKVGFVLQEFWLETLIVQTLAVHDFIASTNAFHISSKDRGKTVGCSYTVAAPYLCSRVGVGLHNAQDPSSVCQKRLYVVGVNIYSGLVDGLDWVRPFLYLSKQ